MADTNKALREHLVELLGGGNAHAGFDQPLGALPAGLEGKRPEGAPHSAWELLEHMRIAQQDILEFSRNPKHVSPAWPDGYWPKTAAPPSAGAWAESVRQFRADLEAMQQLVRDPATDLFASIPRGEGKTILREALLVADHNSYHLGELVFLRRLLGAWKSE